MHSAEVAIIGGGIMGLSTAYHLAVRGCRDVILVEQADLLGSGATGQNAGGIRHQFSSRVNIELSKLSISRFENFSQEFDQDIGLNFCGYLFLLDCQSDVQAFRHNVELQRSLGVETRWLPPEELELKLPGFKLDDIQGATFFERDGLADPGGVIQGYARRCLQLGVTILTQMKVVEILRDRDAVRGIRTTRGDISAEKILIAAGPWSGDVARMAGTALPVQPLRRQILVSRPLHGIEREFPFVIDFSRSLYFHYEGGGILTGMSNPNEVPGFRAGIDDNWREVHLAAATTRFPRLGEAQLLREWSGHYEVTPDNQPILGRLDPVEGLYACAGFSGHGFMHGPAAGLLLAEEMLDGEAHTIDISSLHWRRFEDQRPAGETSVI